jgi:hypothetical protein
LGKDKKFMNEPSNCISSKSEYIYGISLFLIQNNFVGNKKTKKNIALTYSAPLAWIQPDRYSETCST